MSFFNPFRSTPGKTDGGKKQSQAGVPLELISYDIKTEKFNLGREALQVLRSVRLSIKATTLCTSIATEAWRRSRSPLMLKRGERTCSRHITNKICKAVLYRRSQGLWESLLFAAELDRERALYSTSCSGKVSSLPSSQLVLCVWSHLLHPVNLLISSCLQVPDLSLLRLSDLAQKVYGCGAAQ